MSIAEKLTTIAENEQKVYESGKKAGQNSMVDPTKIIEKTASGIGSVTVDDVSEIPHEIKVQLSSDTITDFSGVTLKKYPNNLFVGKLAQGSFSTTTGEWNSTRSRIRTLNCIYLTEGTYTLFTDKDKKFVLYVYDEQGNFLSADSLVTWQTNKLTFTFDEPRLIHFGIQRKEDVILPEEVKVLVLEKGETITEEIITVNADGTAKCKSCSPNMILAVDNKNININIAYRESWSKQEERKRFWEVYQNGGEQENYEYAFWGNRWNDANFRPQYDIRPKTATAIFRSNRITDLAKILEDCGVVLDTSLLTSVSELFSYGSITHLPVISTISAENINTLLYNNSSLIKVDKVILREDGSQTFGTNCFNGISALVDILFEGVIGQTVSFAKGKVLSKASHTNIMSVLSNSAEGMTITFNLNAVNTAFETSSGTADGSTSEEWLNLVATKPNWTISLA